MREKYIYVPKHYISLIGGSTFPFGWSKRMLLSSVVVLTPVLSPAHFTPALTFIWDMGENIQIGCTFLLNTRAIYETQHPAFFSSELQLCCVNQAQILSWFIRKVTALISMSATHELQQQTYNQDLKPMRERERKPWAARAVSTTTVDTVSDFHRHTVWSMALDL